MKAPDFGDKSYDLKMVYFGGKSALGNEMALIIEKWPTLIFCLKCTKNSPNLPLCIIDLSCALPLP